MTPKERAREATWEAGRPDWGSDDQRQLELAVEQAIIAAIEEDRNAWVMGQNEYLIYFCKWLELNGYRGEAVECYVESFLNHFHDEHDIEQKEGPSDRNGPKRQRLCG